MRRVARQPYRNEVAQQPSSKSVFHVIKAHLSGQAGNLQFGNVQLDSVAFVRLGEGCNISGQIQLGWVTIY